MFSQLCLLKEGREGRWDGGTIFLTTAAGDIQRERSTKPTLFSEGREWDGGTIFLTSAAGNIQRERRKKQGQATSYGHITVDNSVP